MTPDITIEKSIITRDSDGADFIRYAARLQGGGCASGSMTFARFDCAVGDPPAKHEDAKQAARAAVLECLLTWSGAHPEQFHRAADRAASIAAEVTNWADSIDHLDALSNLDPHALEDPEDSERMHSIVAPVSPIVLTIARSILSHNYCIAIGRA